MKKILSILTIVTLIFTSCNSVIDIEQPGLLPAENAFKSVTDLELGVLGIYRDLDNTTEIRANAVFTDELSIGAENGGQNVSQYSLNLNPNSGIPLSIWTSYYITLNRLNKVLVAADKVPVKIGEEARFKNAKGELFAIRAYCHFQLQTYFTTNYTDDSALGAILILSVPSITDKLARNTNGEVFTAIDADLTTANALLSESANNNRISKDFITALKARMAAYRGQYTLANGFASTLIAKYPLSNQTQFINMFSDTDDSEIIFELDRTVGDIYDNQGTTGGGWAGSLFAFISSDNGGGPFMEMSRSLYNKLTPGDVRLTRYIHPTSNVEADYVTNAQTDILLINKYPGSDNQPLMNDIKIFRSAEMVLIKAEALADAGNFSGAAALVKTIRDARFGAPQAVSFANEQEAFAGILAERRLELAFEGHRWIDIKRLGQRAGVSIDRDAVDCTLYSACALSNTDYRFTMPIPLSEMDVNSALVQNTGY